MESASKTAATVQGIELARLCARFADDKQAEDIQILDLRGISQITDFFVICSGNAYPHLRAIRNEILQELAREHGIRPYHRDGVAESHWMVLDYVDVIVHVFHAELRSRYTLEDLWSDAPRLDWQTGEPIPQA